MAKEFLVKFKQNQKIVSVGEEDNLRNVMKETFGLKNDDFIIQNFDKEWDDWIDVSDISQVPNRTILRCVIPVPEKPSSVSSPTTNAASYDDDSDTTIILETDPERSSMSPSTSSDDSTPPLLTQRYSKNSGLHISQ